MKDTQIDNVSVPEPDMVEMATTVAFIETHSISYMQLLKCRQWIPAKSGLQGVSP